MCGILGVVERDRSSVSRERLGRAADTLRNRGPDDVGLWQEENIALAHRRLAIIDVSPGGHQPMVSDDGRFVIVFNGEIYNFGELREAMFPGGRIWRSNSDTEVILAAYREWGTDCVQQLNGMFAFAIWDRQEKSLFAARDRMGVKPFYYTSGIRRFAFASRPRALLSLCPDLPRDVDEQALRFYLEAGYIPAPYSINRDMRKLPPGHWLLLDGDTLTIERYWDFRHIEPEQRWQRRQEADLLDELDEIVSRSVRLRMISDVPIGAFLSGGIDSSLVVALMARYSHGRVKTFTVGFDEPAYDESSHAKVVAHHIGTDHCCERLGVDELLGLLPTFTQEFDEPFFDSSAIPTMAVSRLARNKVTVSLSGDGGDELFGGYHYYRIAQGLAPIFKLPGVLRRLLASLPGALPQHRFKLLAGAMRRKDSVDAFGFSRSIAKDFPSVLSPEVCARTVGIGDLFVAASAAFPSQLCAAEKGMRIDAHMTLPDDYLQKVDVASMAFSLESRDPLLDHNLVEWAMRLPITWKLREGTNKYLLRKLAYRYIPRQLLDRPKQGFSVPTDRWLRGPLKDWALNLLSSSPANSRLPLNWPVIRQILSLHLSGAREGHALLWAVLVLLQFEKHLNV